MESRPHGRSLSWCWTQSEISNCLSVKNQSEHYLCQNLFLCRPPARNQLPALLHSSQTLMIECSVVAAQLSLLLAGCHWLASKHLSRCWPLPTGVPPPTPPPPRHPPTHPTKNKNKPGEFVHARFEVIYKLKARSRLAVSVAGPLASAGNTIIFSPRPSLSTRLFTGIRLNFIIETRGCCACVQLPCGHYWASVQRTNGVQEGGGEGWGGVLDILINSLAQMTSSQFYLFHQSKNNMHPLTSMHLSLSLLEKQTQHM